MKDGYSKSERRRLRELVAQAYENELSKALQALFDEFTKWRDNGLGPVELNEKIHEFHNGISRELYKLYLLNDPTFAVAIGLHRKAISPVGIGPELLQKLRPLSEAFEE